MTSTAAPRAPDTRAVGALRVIPFTHPQGCRSYLVADPTSGQALALDVHLDLVDAVEERARSQGWTIPYVVDSHTHADHPSGAAGLAERFGSTRIAHEKAHHRGVARHPADGDALHLGDEVVTVRHAPGHTPDHIVLLTDGALFSGDTLLIGAVARTDFLGGDAGLLFDSIHALIDGLPDDTLLYPGHDYAGRTDSTLGAEKRANPWLQVTDRAAFVRQLTANPPPRPANMDALLELNREGVAIPSSISASAAIDRVMAGGAGSLIDVRFGVEVAGEHVPGSRHIELSEITARADEVRAVAAPRLLLCRTGVRAEDARRRLEKLGIGGLCVVEGGIVAYRSAGGATEVGQAGMSLERQVRIAAGALVLTGALLAWFVHPAFVWLSAFVGAGLVFAGVTDTCGMGILLARAPWNRASVSTGPASGGTCAASAPSPSGGGCAASAPPSSGGGCAATPPSST